MTARHKVSSAALELIMRFEGYRRRAARLADGRWTVGYGHTLTAREGVEVSPEDAETLLRYDIRPIAAAVNELTYTPLTQNQFDALVAFVFNVGIDNFRRSSVIRRVNEGALIQAACALEMWRKADFEGERIVVDALVRRRAAEKALFLTPSDGWIPAPSPILRPRVDFEVGAPKNAAELETSLTGEVAEAHRTDSSEPGAASMAAADAVSARLNEILPETAAAPPSQESAEPVFMIDPEPTPDMVQTPEASQPVHMAEAATPAASLAAPPLFNALFGAEAAPEPSQTSMPAEQDFFTPDAIEAPSPFADAQPAPQIKAERDSRFDIPEREPAELSHRVIWREAPMETDASRLLGDGLDGLTPLWLLLLFLAGLAVFAGGIVSGLNAKGSGLISWGLGLIGIICVVSAVYVYLERLGGRED